jgi:hypothetical protein
MCDCWYSPENFEGYCILLVKWMKNWREYPFWEQA